MPLNTGVAPNMELTINTISLTFPGLVVKFVTFPRQEISHWNWKVMHMYVVLELLWFIVVRPGVGQWRWSMLDRNELSMENDPHGSTLYPHDSSSCTPPTYINSHPEGFWGQSFYGLDALPVKCWQIDIEDTVLRSSNKWLLSSNKWLNSC